jgi:hypothetical protein
LPLSLKESIVGALASFFRNPFFIETREAKWKAQFERIRSHSVVHRLYPYAITKPVFTVSDVQKDLKVSFAAASAASRTLQDAGILSVPNDASRNRFFHADEVLEVFDRFRTPRPSSAGAFLSAPSSPEDLVHRVYCIHEAARTEARPHGDAINLWCQ